MKGWPSAFSLWLCSLSSCALGVEDESQAELILIPLQKCQYLREQWQYLRERLWVDGGTKHLDAIWSSGPGCGR